MVMMYPPRPIPSLISPCMKIQESPPRLRECPFYERLILATQDSRACRSIRRSTDRSIERGTRIVRDARMIRHRPSLQIMFSQLDVYKKHTSLRIRLCRIARAHRCTAGITGGSTILSSYICLVSFLPFLFSRFWPFWFPRRIILHLSSSRSHCPRGARGSGGPDNKRFASHTTPRNIKYSRAFTTAPAD